jgi:hypothetical protein
LHCGNFDERRDDRAEAAGCMPEFELSDSRRVIADSVQRVSAMPRLVRS